jgi:mono/diheme cytochrome c family protein
LSELNRRRQPAASMSFRVPQRGGRETRTVKGMNVYALSKTLVAIGLTLTMAAAAAQPRVDEGKLEYDGHCAICHGPTGTGNGEMRRWLTKAPSDLTTLSKRYGGAFPNQLVWEVIDGRSSLDVGLHGSREMPVWGQRYRQEALAQAGTAAQPEWYVRNRVVALLDYLSRIQAK